MQNYTWNTFKEMLKKTGHLITNCQVNCFFSSDEQHIKHWLLMVQILLEISYLQVGKSGLRHQVCSRHFGWSKMAIHLFYKTFTRF